MSPIHCLEAADLACVRGGRLVFRDVSLRADAGAVLAIEGPNGAGKTSLLRMIAGFLAPASGTIRITQSGKEIADAEERGKFVGWFAHQDAAKAQLTPEENLRFHAALYGVAGDVTVALARAGLARVAGLACQYLSAGQKKRLALARLSLLARPLWLLDEPFAALDASGKALALELIAEQRARGGIVIAATHERLGIDCATLELA